MKKLAIALATFGALAIATPAVFACPGHDGEKSDNAPKTAESEKSKEKKAPAKKAPKKDEKKDTEKKDGDKVSMK
jgi:hypothetical protein